MSLPPDEIRLKRRVRMFIFCALAVLCLAAPVFAESAEAANGTGPPLFIGMLGGLALFLYGMDQMGGALKGIAGRRMKMILSHLTANRLIGFMTGGLFTAIIQSSSITTVLAVGFAAAGLLTLKQSIGVILGADVGTTFTVQIIAFKATKYALLLVAAGFALQTLGRRDALKQAGGAILGLGLIFFGMTLMSESAAPLRDSQAFREGIARMHPLTAIAAAAAFTAAVQASAATIGVVIALSSQGLITLEGGIALMLGANIGTCATAGLAAIGKPREAVRVAAAHVSFKVLGVALIYPVIPLLARMAEAVSPAAPAGLSLLDARAAITPRQLANAHTLFNVGIGVLFLPWAGPFAAILRRLIPDRKVAREEGPDYLDKSLLDTPALALGMARRQINVMADTVERMLVAIPGVLFKPNGERAEHLAEMDNRVDRLHEHMVEYLSKLGREQLSQSAGDEALDVVTVSAELEAIGDIIENNIAHLARARNEKGLTLSEEEDRRLREYYHSALKAFRAASTAFVTANREMALMVIGMKAEMQQKDLEAEEQEFRLLTGARGGGGMEAFIWQRDVLENFKRIYYHAKRIAKITAHVAGVAARDDEDE